MMIPDEAIEAAAESLVGSTLGDRRGINWEEFFEAARGALKAAAPYMLQEAKVAAWGEGAAAEFDRGKFDALPTNPYRPTP